MLITGYDARIERVFLELDTLFQQVIDDHLKAERKERKEDIINVLLKMERDQTESSAPQLTKDNIKAAILLSYEPFPSIATKNEQMKGYYQIYKKTFGNAMEGSVTNMTGILVGCK
jgi:hypothetical protein